MNGFGYDQTAFREHMNDDHMRQMRTALLAVDLELEHSPNACRQSILCVSI